jgi:hypothetical protein
MWHSRTSGILGETGEDVGRRAVQGDLDEDQQVDAQLGRVQQRRVARDITRALQPAHPLQTGRRAEVDLPGQRHVGNAAVGLQRVQDAPVDPVQGPLLDFWHSMILYRWRRILEIITRNSEIQQHILPDISYNPPN